MLRKRASDGDCLTEEDLRRMAMKHASLKQDYNELQRETRAMKKRLQRAKLKKDNLLAEVRFLRRRHKFLKKNSLPSKVFEEVPQSQFFGAQATGNDYKHARRETSFDGKALPQTVMETPYSTPESSHTPESKPLAAKEFQVFWEPLRTTGREEPSTFVETGKRKSLFESNGLASDLKLSIFKDIPNGFVLPNRAGKRKISWQDQMALKV